jgi:hypothetical protein
LKEGRYLLINESSSGIENGWYNKQTSMPKKMAVSTNLSIAFQGLGGKEYSGRANGHWLNSYRSNW